MVTILFFKLRNISVLRKKLQVTCIYYLTVNFSQLLRWSTLIFSFILSIHPLCNLLGILASTPTVMFRQSFAHYGSLRDVAVYTIEQLKILLLISLRQLLLSFFFYFIRIGSYKIMRDNLVHCFYGRSYWIVIKSALREAPCSELLLTKLIGTIFSFVILSALYILLLLINLYISFLGFLQ